MIRANKKTILAQGKRLFNLLLLDAILPYLH